MKITSLSIKMTKTQDKINCILSYFCYIKESFVFISKRMILTKHKVSRRLECLVRVSKSGLSSSKSSKKQYEGRFIFLMLI